MIFLIKSSTVPETGQGTTQRIAHPSRMIASGAGCNRVLISTWSFFFNVDLDFVVLISPESSNIDGGTGESSYVKTSERSISRAVEYHAGTARDRDDLVNKHEEADAIIAHQSITSGIEGSCIFYTCGVRRHRCICAFVPFL